MMPFGATVAGDVFQCKLHQCFGNLKNVIVIADDIMIVGKKPSHINHDQTLTTLFETARKCNVWLNYNKLQYNKQEVDFFSETYTTNSCKSDKSKVTTITKMPTPTSKKQVQSFIGMINYLSKFSARLSEIAESIWELAKDKVPFNWAQNINLLLQRWSKKLFTILSWLIIILRNKLSCKLMQASRV